MARCVHDPQFGRRPSRFDEGSRIRDRDHIVVRTVHHEERARSQELGRSERIERRNLVLPRLGVVGELRIGDEANRSRVLEKASRFVYPFLQRCGRAEGCDPAYPSVISSNADRKRTPKTGASDPDAADIGSRNERVDGRLEIATPSFDRKVTWACTSTAKIHCEYDPARVTRKSFRQIRIRRCVRCGSAGSARQAVTENQSGCACQSGRTRQVRGERQSVYLDSKFHSTLTLVGTPLSCRIVTPITPQSLAPACKEWGAVVRALLEGEQVLDVRKGGIRETGRQFELEASRFLLFPTVEHQQPELLKPAYQSWVSPEQFRTESQIIIGGWADVMHHAFCTTPEQLQALDSKLIWTEEYANARLAWKARQPLWVLVLRVHRFLEPIVIPDREQYHGCSSWCDLADLEANPFERPSEPALSDTAFAGRINQLPEWCRPV